MVKTKFSADNFYGIGIIFNTSQCLYASKCKEMLKPCLQTPLHDYCAGWRQLPPKDI